jgi:tRNA dimethylallyltransferase
MHMRKAILILGPTASGKTALALALAHELNGEIINADSMQVYADLRILTARPTATEEASAPHHLFGTVDGAARFSVGEWLRAAAPLVKSIREEGKTPIVVGGTGLYFKALTEGLAEIPEPPAMVTRLLREEEQASGPEALHAQLTKIDPETAAKLNPADGVRIVRALAVWEATGRSISAYQKEAAPPTLAASDWIGLALTPDRASLYARIDARFGQMLREGALEEVIGLIGRRLDPTLPVMKAHGVPWLTAHIRGEMELAEAAELSMRDTRRYAKRQFTWIAHQAADFHAVAAEDLVARATQVRGILGA